MRNLIISDLQKQFYNQGKRPPLYFWRDQNGRIEVDCIIDTAAKLFPVEIKASQTLSLSFFDVLERWNEISATSMEDNYLVYAGEENQTRKAGHVVGWQSAGNLIHKISA